MAESTPKSTRRTLLEILGLVVAVLTFFWTIRADRTKELTVRFLSRKALVSTDARSSQTLKMSVGAVQVKQPWLISIRVENTGGLPIETRDIERPPILHFTTGRVVVAEVVRKSPSDLAASIQFDSNSVEVTHQLLNPGDAVDVDVLVDGEPTIPAITVRISGINHAKIELPAASASGSHVTPWLLPRTVDLLILVYLSFFALALTGGGVGLLGSGIASAFGRPRLSEDALSIELAEVAVLLNNRPDVPSWMWPVRVVSASELDSPTKVEMDVDVLVSKADLQAAAINPKDAPRLVREKVRELIPEAVSNKFYRRLPAGLDAIVRQRVRDIPFTQSSVEDYLSNVRTEVKKLAEKSPGLRGLDLTQVGSAIWILSSGILLAGLLWPIWSTR